ncbi:YrdB family protein [Psychromicrobium lacuslunae]|uniref:YrdB family protein n=1 Tax=Psychromicrobium lacuslunae TaxID=1618207 RepID=UPI0009E4FD58|nr:YrdB family protein [Psychromicrobium lacuslunae]
MQLPVESTSTTRTLTAVNSVIAFLLEVAMLVAIFFWGFRSLAAPWGVLIGIVAAAVIVVFWSYLMAPKAKYRLSWPTQPIVALLLFLLAGLGLLLVKLPIPGIIMIVLALLNTALSFYLRHRSAGQPKTQPGEAEAEHKINGDIEGGDESSPLPPEHNG